MFGRPIDREEDFLGREQEKAWIREAITRGSRFSSLGRAGWGGGRCSAGCNATCSRGGLWSVEPMCDLTPASMVLGIANELGKAEAAVTLTRAEATSGEAASVLMLWCRSSW